MYKALTTLSLITALFASPPLLAQRVAPAKVQAVIISKVLAFNTNLGSEDFVIHVIGEGAVAKELRKLIGTKCGNATLKDVSEGAGAPDNGAKVIYLQDANAEVIAFSRNKKLLTITGNPSLVSDSVSLGVGVENDKPVILLNLANSKEEGIVWNPAILRVATKVD
jgi:hypothetical protein